MNKVLYRASRQILKSLLRILYRKGVAFGEFNQLVKQVYVEVCEEALQQVGERPTTSRIAITSGLTRKEVARLRQDNTAESGATHSYNRGIRVLTGWLQDPEFQDAHGQPALLAQQGEGSSFATLVSRYSGDMPYRAMLQEMERLGVVKIHTDKQVELISAGYIPQADEGEKLAILGTDVAELIATIDYNLQGIDTQSARFQRKVSYDSLPPEALPAFQRMVEQDGMQLLLKWNDYLAAAEQHAQHTDKTALRRAGVGIYYFEDAVPLTDGKGSRDED